LQIAKTNTAEDIDGEASKDVMGKGPSEDVNEPDEEDVDDAEEEPDALLGEENEGDEQDLEPLGVELQRLNLQHEIPSTTSKPTEPQESNQTPPSQLNLNTHPTPLYDDPSDSDDGEGEWITPSNVSLHKSRALDLLPMASAKGKGKPAEVIGAGCMTADFAMQNVLLQMGLSLVGVEGQRIEKVKSWVLRCHACFKCVSFFFFLPSMISYFLAEYAKTPRKNSAPHVETLPSSAHP
jgi:RNA-binding protein NOB1